jgi:aspartyl-tRNA(Asn)/glutamyl-tRNA(Gln) amidotransferase subunit B
MKYDVVIGIENHVELKTKTKMFSRVLNSFGKVPNSAVSALDLSLPGTMPKLNKEAVILGIKACSGLNLEIARTLSFDRKNYFYPDLPKGYQITQDKNPLGRNGYLEIVKENGEKKIIHINRLHLEEDTAKQIHLANSTLLDYNRCGVPLAEIVSEPEMSDSSEAMLYVSKLRDILLFLGVSDCKMEEGSIRCDINVSLKPAGQLEFGTKVEIKNLNSISNIKLALDYEIARQTTILDDGGTIQQETRRFNEKENKTISMRVKTDAVDYKFFTEPNILPIKLKEEFIQGILENLPLSKESRQKKYLEYGLNTGQIEVLLKEVEVSDFYDSVLSFGVSPVGLVNFLSSDILAYLNKNNKTINELNIGHENLSKLLKMHEKNIISTTQRTKLFEELCKLDRDVESLAKELNLIQNSDSDFLTNIVDEVMKAFPETIEQYKGGKTNVLAFLVGQVMKRSKGQANPKLVTDLLLKILNS